MIKLNEKYQVSIIGEGGEYETFVLNAPYFKKQIRLVNTEKIWDGVSGYLLIKDAVLQDKLNFTRYNYCTNNNCINNTDNF